MVGQYPRFLRAHWKFLKTVINKLFEFMHETHPGVQDMACDTFLKISIKCKRKFVIQQVGEGEPFVAELLRNLNDTIKLLEPHQVHAFYESVGHMIGAETDPQKREEYLQRLMEPPNSIWRSILQQARSATAAAVAPTRRLPRCPLESQQRLASVSAPPAAACCCPLRIIPFLSAWEPAPARTCPPPPF